MQPQIYARPYDPSNRFDGDGWEPLGRAASVQVTEMPEYAVASLLLPADGPEPPAGEFSLRLAFPPRDDKQHVTFFPRCAAVVLGTERGRVVLAAAAPREGTICERFELDDPGVFIEV